MFRDCETIPATIRKVVLLALIALFVILELTAYLQFYLAKIDLDRNLEATLSTEGQAIAQRLSEALAPIEDLDPFVGGWDRPTYSPVLTGSSWVLLDASGEIATSPSGEMLYERPAGASAEVVHNKEPDLVREAARSDSGTVVASLLTGSRGAYSKRVYIPVRELSGLITQPWVLVGQAGEGYFSDLFAKQRRFWWTASVLTLASAVFLVLLLRGIFRTERMERELREAEESIELESLTSTLAHELRNPLSIIQSTAEILLRDEDLTEDGRGLLDDLISEVERSQDVLSRHLHPERQPVGEIDNLARFCKEYWLQRSAYLETHRIRLQTAIPPDRPPLHVRAAPARLVQILDNLLRNSIEATAEGGEIHFELTESGDSAVVRFCDSGPGLGRSSSFWKDGWRLGSSKPQGRGIGLRLARKWVAQWGGELHVTDIRSGTFSRPRGVEVRIALKRV